MVDQLLSAFGNRMIINSYRYVSGVTTLLSDTLTDTDATELSTHPPEIDTIGGGWIDTFGPDMDIESNKAVVQTSSDALYMVDVGETEVTVIVKSELRGYSMLICRATNAVNSGWRIYTQTGTGALQLYENATLRATGSLTLLLGNTYELKMICVGSSIKCYVDGGLEIDYTATGPDSYGNYIGIQGGISGTGATFDDIIVTTP